MPLKIIPIEQVGVKKVEEQLPTDTPHDFDDDGNPIFDLQIDNWTMVNKNLPSMKLKFILLQRREMAIEVMAWPAMKAASRCNRCGREITHPASMLLGYGIDCVQRVGLGHEWIRACDTLTPLQILDIQNKARKEAAVRVWLPLSRCTINGVYGGLYWEITTLLDSVSNVKAPPKIPFTMKLTVNQFRGAISRMIAITCPPAFGDQMKEIRDKYKGSHWNNDMKAWLFPFTRETSIELAKGYGSVCESIDQEILDLVEQHEQEQEAQINKSLNEFDPIPFAKVEPWLHQQRAYYFIRNLNAAMLAMEMGTGKSAVVVHDIANDVDPATGKDGLFYIIVAPKTVVRGVWPNQFNVHTDKPITVMPLTKGTGFHKESEMLAAIGRAKQSGKKVVFIISYQSIYREPLGKFILGRKWDGIYLDESHKIKRPKGIASVFCGKLGKVARKRRILTGTPMPHSPLDIWSQYRALDSTIFGGSFTAFKSQYADYVNRGNYDQILGYINTNKLTEKVFSVAYRITKREALPNLPPVMFTERTVNLEPKARKLYDQMAKELIIMIEEGMISAANILVKLLRLQQIACGSVTDDDGVLRTVSTAKRDGLEEIMDDMPINKPLVVFCRFTHDLRVVRELCASQGRTYAELSGRSNQLADWQAGEYDVLGVQIQAGGVGIDLTRADTDIYYSVGYSLGDYEQALSRIDRPGQEMPVNHILLVAENTIDRRIYGALASKRDIQRGIMDTALELLRPMQGVTPIDTDSDDDDDNDTDEDSDDWGEK